MVRNPNILIEIFKQLGLSVVVIVVWPLFARVHIWNLSCQANTISAHPDTTAAFLKEGTRVNF